MNFFNSDNRLSLFERSCIILNFEFDSRKSRWVLIRVVNGPTPHFYLAHGHNDLGIVGC